MATAVLEIREQALKLPSSERAQLAQDLIASLDENDEAENERLWIEEAERRYDEYKKGLLSSRPACEVFREAFARYA